MIHYIKSTLYANFPTQTWFLLIIAKSRNLLHYKETESISSLEYEVDQIKNWKITKFHELHP